MSADRPLPARGRHATTALALTVVLGTVLLLWAADRLARWGAESVLARVVQEQTGVLDRPTVQVRGGPVLLQALRGRYDDVLIEIDALSSGPVRLRDYSAELDGVYLALPDLLDGNADRVFAERSAERALLSYEDLDRYLRFTGRVLGAEPSADRLGLTGTVDVRGAVRPVSAAVDVRAEDGALLVRPTEVTTTVPLEGIDELLVEQRFTFPVPLDPLLFERGEVGVAVRPSGLAVSATGSGVVLGT